MVRVGEAAHIYGAAPGSARYRPEMTPTERRDISNAIWLCRICAWRVDKDQKRYPASSLRRWKARHEEAGESELGNPRPQTSRSTAGGTYTGGPSSPATYSSPPTTSTSEPRRTRTKHCTVT